jgi:hypothetical protein
VPVVLLLMVTFDIANDPELQIPAPRPPEPPKLPLLGGAPLPVRLPVTTTSLSVSVPALRMPPPLSPEPPKLGAGTPSAVLPLLMVKPETATVVPELILKMRKFGVPPAVLR